MAEVVDLAIVGSGAAGLAAAVTAARLGVAPWVIEGLPPGGRLSQGTDVDAYPGFPKGIPAADLVVALREQAEKFGARFVRGVVQKVALGTRPFAVEAESGPFAARALIAATGARPRKLEVPGAEELWGYGVSSCATCDGFFCRDERVVVVGGGDEALDDALYLATMCSGVLVVHRGEALGAARALVNRAAAEPKIEIAHRTEVVAVRGARGEGGVSGVALRDLATGAARDEACRGLWVAIGVEPASELWRDQVETHPDGTLAVRAPSTATSVPGLFAAGDVADAAYRQLATATGDGCRAAIDAVRFLHG